jgi:pimeloyl-ACP methyl ester carboxylesterase
MSGSETIISLADVKINIDQRGNGTPTLLFVHYWGGSSRTWSTVMDWLSPRTTAASHLISVVGAARVAPPLITALRRWPMMLEASPASCP